MTSVYKVAIVLSIAIVAIVVAFTASTSIEEANPASVYCTEQGGTLTLVSTEEGVIGECELADGTICEEWAYFRGECGESTE